MSTALARRKSPLGRTVGYAAAILGVGAAGGAAIGSVNAAPCASAPQGALCGPVGGAVKGAMVGLMVSGGFGLLLTASREWRAVGITTAGLGFAAFVATGFAGAAMKNAQGGAA